MSNARRIVPKPLLPDLDENGFATMRVVMDEDQLRQMIKPVLDEVNDLRRRVKALEEGAVDDGR